MKKAVLSFYLFLLFITANAQNLPQWAIGLKGADLKEAIRINCYPDGFTEGLELFYALLEIDSYDNGSYLLNRFSDVAIPIENNRAENVYFLYAMPPDWWAAWFDDKPKITADLHNMFLCEIDLIDKRMDFMPGVPDGEVYWTNGLWSIGEDSRTCGVWTFPEGYEGEMARALLYMATVYPADLWNGRGAMFMTAGNYPSFSSAAIDYLLKFHRDNPPSEREEKRNDYIEAIQGNPNPFVRWPELVSLVWNPGEDDDSGQDSGSVPPVSDEENDKNVDGDKEDDGDNGSGNEDEHPSGDDDNQEDNAGDNSGDEDNESDNDPEPEIVPLKGFYSMDETLFLSSPFIPSDAEWKIDGIKSESMSVPCSDLGAGKHELRFKSSTVSGIITISISE